MAQMASRASVELYVGLALKARGIPGTATQDAFVIRTFWNGVNVLGIEGLVMFKRKIQFDAKNYTVSVPNPDAGAPTTISV
ncbi:exosome catalytic subunit dis3 [Steccherinum ochraceum]|uniref:Exosome catalytic subunit dis3 n=1 Tax=Steccherinum ochraceum TaxID=92696 RepID=A0A4R0RYT0_9APHY|nr:exosome catalytic subunit dis3 [Steccherinum ochraceum]